MIGDIYKCIFFVKEFVLNVEYFFKNKSILSTKSDFIPRKSEGFFYNETLYIIAEIIHIFESDSVQISLLEPEEYARINAKS